MSASLIVRHQMLITTASKYSDAIAHTRYFGLTKMPSARESSRDEFVGGRNMSRLLAKPFARMRRIRR